MTLALLLGGCTRSLIYFPSNPSEHQLRREAAAAGLEPWTTATDERIGWVAPAASDASPAERSAMVVFHGNAGHAAHRSYYADGFAARNDENERPWDVYLFEYPGYGSRDGSPSEETIKDAALDAVQRLREEGYGALYLAGESLGSGVACYLAAELPEMITGLCLVTPFTSLEDVARAHYPGFLVRLILRERYDNEAALRHFAGRVAILLAGEDEVIPMKLGRRLYSGYDGPKRLWIQDGRTHNTLSLGPGAAWWSEVRQFLTTAE